MGDEVHDHARAERERRKEIEITWVREKVDVIENERKRERTSKMNRQTKG